MKTSNPTGGAAQAVVGVLFWLFHDPMPHKFSTRGRLHRDSRSGDMPCPLTVLPPKGDQTEVVATERTQTAGNA